MGQLLPMRCLQFLAGRIPSGSLNLVLAGSLLLAGCGSADTTDGVIVPDTRGEKQFDQMKEYMEKFKSKKGRPSKKQISAGERNSPRHERWSAGIAAS